MSSRNDAIAIWKAAVTAVDSAHLVQQAVLCDQQSLTICGETFALHDLNRLIVVGAGKAGAGMARGLEQSLTPSVLAHTTGWVNVPENCVCQLEKIHLHGARPAGMNEPTAAGVRGAQEILNLVQSMQEGDLCLVLISGGGSALLPAPVETITLADKLAVTKLLSSRGASIEELNTVRKQLSKIKGGGLVGALPAGRMLTLIISDVIGDPLDVIASGPTVADRSTPQAALEVLQLFDPDESATPTAVLSHLKSAAEQATERAPIPNSVSHHIIGNNQTALKAAEQQAIEYGYEVISQGSQNVGIAEEVGVDLAAKAVQLRDERACKPPLCLLRGGEPVVKLAETSQPRKGGRNQELVLSALSHLQADGMRGITILSGGTDGEDGPTDAAGAFADAQLLQQMIEQQLEPEAYLAINNAYPFFQQLGGLLFTGPTHTNVMDVAVVIVESA